MGVMYAGALLERPPGRRYLSTLRFAEIAPKHPLPRPGTLARWRRTLPEGFVTSLVAPRETFVSARGPLRFDEGLEERFAWLLEAADAIGARVLVVPTAAELTTGQRDRDLLRWFFDRVPRRTDRAVVWAPGGLWEPDEAYRQARRMNVVYGFDPLESPVPPGPLAYARLQGVGARIRLTEGMLWDAYARLATSEARETFVAIESPRSFREACTLQRVMAAEADELALEEGAAGEPSGIRASEEDDALEEDDELAEDEPDDEDEGDDEDEDGAEAFADFDEEELDEHDR